MKSCPRCRESKDLEDYYTRYDGISKNQTYCRECQKDLNRKKSSRIKDIILRHTNNGKCWWVYQSILGDRTFRKEK